MDKILTFIVKENKFLLLKGSDKDPQFKESFWYVVTGGVEEEDITLEDTVKREVKEECNINVNNIKYLNWIFTYDSLGEICIEKAYVSFYESGDIKLNEESTDYKWCTIDEVIDLMKWYGDKFELQYVLECILKNELPFKEEKYEKFN